MSALDINRLGPSSPLEVWEIQGLINRLRRAQIAASVDLKDARTWNVLGDALSALQALHVRATGAQY